MKIEENVSLKRLTTMRTGGLARYVVSVASGDDIEDAVIFAESKKLPVMFIGGGSNMVAPDEGFEGVVFLAKNKGVIFEEIGNGFVRVIASAGEVWDELIARTVEEGLYGLENLSYIPGTVGGAAVQNVGAYGREAKDTIEWVRVFDSKARKLRQLTKDECAFGYRDSIFKQKSERKNIITEVSFLLSKNTQSCLEYGALRKYLEKDGVKSPTSQDVRDAVIAIRKSKLPEVSEVGTAGSFFKNPVISKGVAENLKKLFPNLPTIPYDEKQIKIPAAWLIEHIGKWKGYREGDAGVYEKHALVLVNYGKASAREMVSLAEKIENDILKKTGIFLEREVIVWEGQGNERDKK